MSKSNFNDVQGSFPVLYTLTGKGSVNQVYEAFGKGPSERLVPKSERIAALTQEIALTQRLFQRMKAVIPTWYGDGAQIYPYLLSQYKQREFTDKDEEWCSAVRGQLAGMENQLAIIPKEIKNIAGYFHDALLEHINRTNVELEREEKGTTGEDKVEYYLRSNLNCRILSGTVLPAPVAEEGTPKTAETDLLVFSDHGIYVCEVKNYGKAGQTLEVQQDGTIIKQDYYGRFMADMGSPFEQNERHCRAVASVLHRAGLGDIPIYPAVIIANTEANIDNLSDHWITDMYTFREEVANDRSSRRVAPEQIKAAYDAVQAKRMGERAFPMTSYADTADQIEGAITVLEEVTQRLPSWIANAEQAAQQWQEDVYSAWLARNNRLCMREDYASSVEYACCPFVALAVAIYALLFFPMLFEASFVENWYVDLGSGFVFLALMMGFLYGGHRFFKDFLGRTRFGKTFFGAVCIDLLFLIFALLACFVAALFGVGISSAFGIFESFFIAL